MKIKTDIKVIHHVETTYTLKVGSTALRELLIHAGHKVPENAKVTIWIPGGGDYSNCSLDVTDQNQLDIQWKVEKDTESESEL